MWVTALTPPWWTDVLQRIGDTYRRATRSRWRAQVPPAKLLDAQKNEATADEAAQLKCSLPKSWSLGGRGEVVGWTSITPWAQREANTTPNAPGPRERKIQMCVCALVLCVYPVTNTNISTHSQPVDRLSKLHRKTSSKCLQNMGGEDGDFFTAALGLLFGGLEARHSGGICRARCSRYLLHSLNKVLKKKENLRIVESDVGFTCL